MIWYFLGGLALGFVLGGVITATGLIVYIGNASHR